MLGDGLRVGLLELPYVEEFVSSRTVSIPVELVAPLQVERRDREEREGER